MCECVCVREREGLSQEGRDCLRGDRRGGVCLCQVDVCAIDYGLRTARVLRACVLRACVRACDLSDAHICVLDHGYMRARGLRESKENVVGVRACVRACVRVTCRTRTFACVTTVICARAACVNLRRMLWACVRACARACVRACVFKCGWSGGGVGGGGPV